MIRIAAVGDLHFERGLVGSLRDPLERLEDAVDILLIAGDLTHDGEPDQARSLAGELEHAPVPVAAVLGNHDYGIDRQDEITRIITDAGVHVLEGTSVTFEVDGHRVGVAGTKGFGGGWPPCWHAAGEPETRAFIGLTERLALGLEKALAELDADARIALLHYSPIETTISNDPPQLWPWLGSYLLGDAVDNAGADLALHGHVHLGHYMGDTPGGVPVRNVSSELLAREQPGHPFAILRLDPERGLLD
jgi:Icc-related predicted phosphoesterase